MSTSWENDLFSDIFQDIPSIIESEDLPSLTLGIVFKQQLLWHRVFGKLHLPSPVSPDDTTLFRIASITKTFTAAAILKLRDEQKLSLDTPLEQYIPEFSKAQVRAGSLEQVTLRRMLCHHAGLTTEAPLPCWDVLAFPTHDALLAAIPEIEVVLEQDTAFKYSNLAFGLLGEVVRRVSGFEYEDYIKYNFLVPLSMNRTRFHLDDSTRTQCAIGYLPRSHEGDFDPAPAIPLNGLSACGGLYSCLLDLSRWLAFQMSPSLFHSPQGAPLLNTKTVEESHRPMHLEADWSTGYCMAWRAHRFEDHIFHGHGGGIYGFSSQVLFCKSNHLGIICFANRWPFRGLQDLSGSLLRRLIESGQFGHPSPIGSETITRSYPSFVGTYTAYPGITLQVALRMGQLHLLPIPDCDFHLHVPAILEPSDSENHFVVCGGRGSGERIVFLRPTDDTIQFELGGFVYQKKPDPVT